MEDLRKGRRPVRRDVDVLVDEMEAMLNTAEDVGRVKVQSRLLTHSYGALLEWDRQVFHAMLQENTSDEDQDREFSDVRAYKRKVEAIQMRTEIYLTPEVVPPAGTSHHTSSVVGDSEDLGFRLPTFKFEPYDGSYLGWLGFWAQFRKVDQHPKLTGSDKIRYLRMALVEGSEAYNTVAKFPQNDDSYDEAINALKRRFGDNDMLMQVYIRELLKLVISNVNSEEKLPFHQLFNQVDTQLRALKSLNLANADPATWIYPLVESSLPKETMLAWQRSPLIKQDGSQEVPPKTRLDYLMDFLEKEVEIRQRMGIAQEGFGTKADKGSRKRKLGEEPASQPSKRQKGATAACFQNVTARDEGRRSGRSTVKSRLGQRGPVTCIFCKRTGHEGIECYSSAKMTYDERWEIANNLGLCFNCLGRHFARDCKMDVVCPICGGRHCKVMCSKWGKQRITGSSQQPPDNSTGDVQKTKDFVNGVRASPVALQTLNAVIFIGGQRRPIRIFMDNGSQRSYIRKGLIDQLGLKPEGKETVVHELFGGATTETVEHSIYTIGLEGVRKQPGHDDLYQCRLRVRDQPKISSSIPRASLMNYHEEGELQSKGIQLSDVGKDVPPIDILIGADNYGRLLTGELRQLTNGQVAIGTKLGWTLLGEKQNHFWEAIREKTVTSMTVRDYTISQLWDLDTIGIRDSTDVKTEKQQEDDMREIFFKSLTREENGRYVVALPWKDGHPPLPSNRAAAEQRLGRTTQKLRESEHLDGYGKLFSDWETEGFIEEVGPQDTGNLVHYIPHRAVIKDSLTTPVRPVFDASCKMGKVPSLNDCLHKGNNLVQLIPDMLVRFREKKIGFVSDIRKAFQMIGVQESDRDVMRFLWWNPDGTLKTYRHKRVMFGANCSRFILGAVLEYHLTHLGEHQDVGEKLLEAMYVDNCVRSEATVEDYKSFRAISTKILADCQMDLRMWMSNVDEFDDERTLVISVLGMQWDRKEDVLFVKVDHIVQPEKITKRTVLSTAQKVFDPIGVTCPIMIPIKLLLQQAWVTKLKWDEPLSEGDAAKFKRWVEEIPAITSVRISRRVADVDVGDGTWTLHTFTDASQVAYAAVTYIRVEKEGRVTVELFGAKARISPVKRVTIPRLELLGCLIGARLGAAIRKVMRDAIKKEVFWTDSSTALAWIQRDEQWGTYVGNRTTEINQLTRKEDWRHVPGEMNPADLPSRGCTPGELLKSRWWKGPAWLLESTPTWEEDTEADETIVDSEKRKSVIGKMSTCSMSVLSLNTGGKTHSFSSWVRIVGYVQRFICTKLKLGERRSGLLSSFELKEAEDTVIRKIQRDAFGDTEKTRFTGLDVHTKRVTWLGGTREATVLCVTTRLVRRKDLVCSTTPYLMPGKHPLVRRLIADYHRAYAHAGAGFLVTKLRQKYWVVHSRKSVRSVISKCFFCRKMNARPFLSDPAPLPLDRIKDAGVFEVVGVDLAGPFILKTGKKTWMAIFTCAVYRAVHLDLLDSLSTKAFLNCLGRFIEKYGRPAIIYSDNGTNFRGSENLFKSLDWDRIQKEENVKQITWKFNPPSGPWWGGWWERLIRTIKDLLKRTCGKSSLTRTELHKTLKVIEGVMNDRPLTYVSESSDDLEPLTPNMFIRPVGSFQFPEGDHSEGDKMRMRHNYLKTLWEEMKMRFQKEYLSLLVSKSRKKPTRGPIVGELVIIGDDQQKREKWPLGRIVELLPGQDGISRVAKVKMEGGYLLRPVQRLHPLELDADAAEVHHMRTRSKAGT